MRYRANRLHRRGGVSAIRLMHCWSPLRLASAAELHLAQDSPQLLWQDWVEIFTLRCSVQAIHSLQAPHQLGPFCLHAIFCLAW